METKLINEYFTDPQHPDEGAVKGFRQGDWFSRTDYQHDAWYACWLNEFVTGYGMALYDKRTDTDFLGRAEKILNMLLSGRQQKDGLFPIICYLEEDGTRTWLNDDGWAGYYQDYHTMMMSWNGYLMLKWAEEIFPDRKEEILNFLTPYADFLLRVMLPSGNIPAWFGEDGKPSREQFREFNAETGMSAAFLMEMGDITGRSELIEAGYKSLDFVSREVRPRERWFDMETFKSCAQKHFGFYDSITAQYPQCNLSLMYAVLAYQKRYELEPTSENLKEMTEVVDYLCMFQQLWNHPEISIDVFGGFTVQNADNEWNDIRESIMAVELYKTYEYTGEWEYMERGVTAMQSGFPPLPYENWAHCGYEGMQYDSSLLWGGGVAMMAAEFYRDAIGDAAFDVKSGKGIAAFGTYRFSIREEGDTLEITADQDHDLGSFRIFGAEHSFNISVNGKAAGSFTADQLKEKIVL